ncbi:MAG: hypothetical protein KBS39_04930, partial [Lachnospiraceae bacterium]|nr:hypothetical protein [Candidatus Hippenecus merdae]
MGTDVRRGRQKQLNQGNLLFFFNKRRNERMPHLKVRISGAFKAPEKANIETEKANIEIQIANIEKAFTTKTAANVIRLWEAFGYHTVFGRSDVVKLLGLKPTRSSELLRDMADRRVIVPVSGQGKGKYRFR